ncbi:hypothetical protein Abr02nite_23830 [Paractinoplanes brasiliensis]|nr:hypothetical protein Abr02nite_23830 [Actinoplanes brasiliensis]
MAGDRRSGDLLPRDRRQRLRAELLHFGYYPSAILYAVYAAFVIWGFVVWLRLSRTPERPPARKQAALPA